MLKNKYEEEQVEPQDRANLLIQLGQIPVTNLELSNRITNALRRAGVMSIGDLTLLSQRELFLIQGIGPDSLAEIQNALNQDLNSPESFIEAASLEQLAEVSQKQSLKTGSEIKSRKNASELVVFGNPAEQKLLIQLGPTNITKLKLSTTVVNLLTRAGIFTIADLAHWSRHELLMLHGVGEKTLVEIQNALKGVLNSPVDYTGTASPDTTGEVAEKQSPQTWAHIIEPFLRSEKENLTYVFISRFGFNKKTLNELAAELSLSRERIRQMERRVAETLIKHTGFPAAIRLLDKILEVLSKGKEDLSLPSLKSILIEKGILGDFSASVKSELYEPDLFEILIGWLDVLCDGRFRETPMSFPIEIGELQKAGHLPVREHRVREARPRHRRSAKAKELLRKVAYTGGIHLTDATKILSTSEDIARLELRDLNLCEIRDQWFSVESFAGGRKALPLIHAGTKMLAVMQDMEFSIFYEGLGRYAGRYFDSLAPQDVVLHYIKLAGFQVKHNRISNSTRVENVLSETELCLIDAIRANENVTSLKEIAEIFHRRKGLSRAAARATLTHLPVLERVDRGLYKIRGSDVSWSAIEAARKRQKTSRKIAR